MTTLNFVALSMQTTHLDPATVSKASYVKLVDGNITRVDAIPIIPPATPAETGAHDPTEAISWPEAIAQLNMIVGKLPIVSYYRDADKEIFQAASRRSNITPPTFHWLDCRALARQALPELPDHQPSTVLQALDLHNDYADVDAVEQTARIVLKLAQQQDAVTVRELWGDLYHQPDDLLDLEAALQDLSNPKTEVQDGQPGDNDEGSATMTQSQERYGPGAAADAVGTVAMEPEADVAPPAVDEASAVNAQESHLENSGVEPSEDATDSTAQSVMDSAHHEEPAFLKIQHDNEPDLHDTFAVPAHDTGTDTVAGSDPVGHNGTEPSTDEGSARSPMSPIPTEDPVTDGGETTPRMHRGDDSATASQATTDHPVATTTPSGGSTAATTPTMNPTEPPAPVARPGQGSMVASTDSKPFVHPLQPEARDRPHGGEQEQTSSPRSGRMWGVVGMVVFGLLTVLGLGLTIMAASLFFMTNDLLFETKIAGVILTGTITLLGLLMMAMSYRKYKKNP